MRQRIACSNPEIMAERGEAAARSSRNFVKLRLDVKPEVLRKVQDSIYFEKTITASSASGYVGHPCKLALPNAFVRQHGEKIRKSVVLVSTKAWPVTIDVCFRFSQAKFSGGWRAFAEFHGLLAGDSLIFLLTAMSRFKVYVFGTGTEGIPAEVQKNFSPGSEVLRRKAEKQSRECTADDFLAEEAIDVKPRGLKPELAECSLKESADRRNAMKPLCTDDIAEALDKLQGSVHFEKKVTASSASDYLGRAPRLALPSEFVRCHGDKFRRSVILRVSSSRKEWPVQLTISVHCNVKLSGGWRAFADFNNLVEGDSLIFYLTAISEFEVYVFSSTGNPKKLPGSQPAPRTGTSNDSESPRKKAKQCKSEPVSVENGVEGAVKLEEAIAQRPTSLQNASPSKDIKSENVKEERIFSEDRHKNSSKTKQELALDAVTNPGASGERHNPRNEHQALRLQENFHLPGFYKKLTGRNVGNGKKAADMELPFEFWKAYRRRLGAVVKLQGIYEESEARPVFCYPSFGRQTRIFLRSGWQEFVNENNLEVGQELKYTLITDSYFVVREVQLPPP